MRRVWRRWHRPLGLLSALPVIVLCVSGVLANHSDDLGLSRKTVPAWLASFYGHTASDRAWLAELDGQSLVQGNDVLILDGDVVAPCASPYLGVLPQPNGWVAGCRGALVMIWSQPSAVEVVDGSWGLPDFDRMGLSAEGLVIAGSNGQFRVDPDTLQFPALADMPTITALPGKQPLSSERYGDFADALVPDAFTWERLVLDVHAFRFLGPAGPWVLDFASMALLVLLVTGLVMWWQSGRRR